MFYQVGIPERFAKYEEDSYKKIIGLIHTIPEGGLGADGEPKLKREVFKSFLDKIYKRQK